MSCCITSFLYSILLYFAIIPALTLLAIRLTIRKLRGKVDITNEVDISGKTVIVTGASDGIGKVTAEEFAVRGARVILACRNLQKAERAVADIRMRTTNGEMIIMHLNLSSLSSVRQFASEFIQKYGGGLSILVNNAGLVNPVGMRKLTEDGFEEAFGVNHLGHFLLTNLLLPELVKAGEKNPSDPSRVVIVSSGAHSWGSLSLDDLMYEKTPLEDWKWISKLYCNSKLANNLFNLELAKKFRSDKVNVNCYALCPGFVDTNIGKENMADNPPPFWVTHVLFPLLKLVMVKDAKEGAETTVYCSLSKYLTHHSGEMYRNCEFWDYSKRPKLSEKDATKLWEKSEKLVKLN
ncbi:retinol dehydrogenase 12 [Folsomia candida]|uniref:Dehydrogenase/reductase SDR family member 13 n=1 Tax=Folsomia candida TaxID=158441 RepID=A0A226EEL0_FOLCA|nr:retinol dehydrogenase 12 [Folsomia candida]OXA55126.1 Dehydrogenase/reductase SDR family member 13 [Folsomia candida]